MPDLLITSGVLVWWTVAVVVFATTTNEREESIPLRIAVSTLWPVISVLSIPLLLWRIPFRTAKEIRADLRNRKLLKEFNEWLKQRKKASTHVK